MRGIFQGFVTGYESWPDKENPGQVQHRTHVSLGPGCDVTLRRNGLPEGQGVFVAGDLRRSKEGGYYFQGESEGKILVVARDNDQTLSSLVQLLQ